MTLALSTRPLTVEEMAAIDLSRPRFGFAVWGAWLGIVPLLIAGMVCFTLLLAGVSDGWALLISYLVGLAFGCWGLRRQYARYREVADRFIARRNAALANGQMQQLAITCVRVWEVVELADFGPGYVIATGADQCVYVRGAQTPESVDEVFPAAGLQIEYLPGLNQIEQVQASPGETKLEQNLIEFARLNVDIWDEVALIPLSQVQMALQPRADIGDHASGNDR